MKGLGYTLRFLGLEAPAFLELAQVAAAGNARPTADSRTLSLRAKPWASYRLLLSTLISEPCSLLQNNKYSNIVPTFHEREISIPSLPGARSGVMRR